MFLPRAARESLKLQDVESKSMKQKNLPKFVQTYLIEDRYRPVDLSAPSIPSFSMALGSKPWLRYELGKDRQFR